MSGLLNGLQTGFAGGVMPFLQSVAQIVSSTFSQITSSLPQLASGLAAKAKPFLSAAQPYISQAQSLLTSGGSFSLGGFNVQVPAGLSNLLHFGGGGLLAEPVYGVGARTGRGYALGESGPEHVVPGSSMARVEALLAALLDATAASPSATGQALADALNGVTRTAAAKGSYAVR